ncbi:MAG: HTTM domain-containing protein [Candidatus Omnitrophota bacterium]
MDKESWSVRIRGWKETLGQPFDPVNLGCFRICFGLLMVLYIYLYRTPAIVKTIYLTADFHFTYSLFDWLGLPFPTAAIMSVLTKVIAVSALFIALGLLTRVSAGVFFLTFGYMFLIEKTHYNNHYYLILLFSFFFIITGSNRFFSLDRLIFGKNRRDYLPYWHLFLFQIQIALVYFFGGLAKLNTDWISGRVTQNIFDGASDGFFFVTATAGLVIDFCVAFMLIYKPLRKTGILLSILFHVFVKYYLNVGVFPFLMIACALLYLEPGAIRNFLGLFREEKDRTVYELPGEARRDPVARPVWIFICVYIGIQVLVPLRSMLYPGHVQWNLKGDRFAWRMFSQDNLGHIDFFVTDVITGDTVEVPRLKGITIDAYSQMAFHPDMILQYARYLHDLYQRKGVYDPIITANSFVSLNGRPFSLFIHSDLNLAHPDIHPDTKDLTGPAPFKKQDTLIDPKNVGRFFSPAYQMAVIDEETLIPGDHPTVILMQGLIDRLIRNPVISPYQISNLVVDLKQILYTEYGHHFTAKQILERIFEKTGPLDTVPSINQLLKYFI